VTTRRASRGPGSLPRRFLLLAAAALIALPGCEKIDRNMYDSPAFKAQEEPVRLPPSDSIPTKGREKIPPLSDAARLENPVKATDGTRLQGKELYGIFCVPCHGESGMGDGLVGKKYLPAPADIRQSAIGGKLSDGELFVIISSGYGGMPALRSDLSPEERWKIVVHLRTLK
jgi:mono/diheme cytochrome c family protein